MYRNRLDRANYGKIAIFAIVVVLFLDIAIAPGIHLPPDEITEYVQEVTIQVKDHSVLPWMTEVVAKPKAAGQFPRRYFFDSRTAEQYQLEELEMAETVYQYTAISYHRASFAEWVMYPLGKRIMEYAEPGLFPGKAAATYETVFSAEQYEITPPESEETEGTE